MNNQQQEHEVVVRRNLVLNIARHGFTVAGYDKDQITDLKSTCAQVASFG
jgi:6-phosphogluconate dehydrogenase